MKVMSESETTSATDVLRFHISATTITPAVTPDTRQVVSEENEELEQFRPGRDRERRGLPTSKEA